MTQNVLQIPTAAPLSGMALVTDVNNALAGLASLCSGGTAPSASSLGLASAAGLLWHDTQANQLKLRNQADSAWIVLGSVNETSGIFVPAAAQVYSPIATATTLALANAGQFLLCSAALALTLPASSGLNTAWSVSIFAKGGPVSLSLANSSDALNGSVGGSVIIPKGYFAELVTDAAGAYSAVAIPASLGISVLASATTTDLGTAASQVVSISGTTTITSFGSLAPAGTVYTLQFAASLTLTYNSATLILPGAASVITAANDCAQVLSLGSGNWICIDYQRANGQPVAGASVVYVSVRQTVLSGDNTNGVATFLTTGSGLVPAFTAGSPLIVSFAGGFGPSGAVDFVSKITAAGNTATCTANTTNYIYATYVSGSSVTWGATTLQPVYQSAAPSSPATGQFWFDLSTFLMKSWSGSAWVVSNTVFLGEVVAGASSITSVISYALQGAYTAPWTNTLPGTSTAITASDNIGTQFKNVILEIMNLTAEAGYSVGDIIIPSTDGNGNLQAFPIVKRRNTSLTVTGGTIAFDLLNLSSGGVNVVATAANWSYRIRANRGF